MFERRSWRAVADYKSVPLWVSQFESDLIHQYERVAEWAQLPKGRELAHKPI